MSMPKPVVEAMNEQINRELYSAYLYLSMAGWFDSQHLPGFASWFRVQAREELAHAERFFDHLIDRGCTPALGAIDAPPSDFGTVHAAADQVLEHERFISASIGAIHDLAIEHSDHASLPMLMWFINEQVEEEKSVQDIIDRLALIESAGESLVLLDQELGARAPASTAE